MCRCIFLNQSAVKITKHCFHRKWRFFFCFRFFPEGKFDLVWWSLTYERNDGIGGFNTWLQMTTSECDQADMWVDYTYCRSEKVCTRFLVAVTSNLYVPVIQYRYSQAPPELLRRCGEALFLEYAFAFKWPSLFRRPIVFYDVDAAPTFFLGGKISELFLTKLKSLPGVGSLLLN